MIWYTRCGYSSVDAVSSADYCRFQRRGILKRAFSARNKTAVGLWHPLYFPCAVVRVWERFRPSAENLASAPFSDFRRVSALPRTLKFKFLVLRFPFYASQVRAHARVRARLRARLFHGGGGGCNKLQFFCAGSGIQNQACIEEPLTSRPSLPTTNTFFYFPPPILSPTFFLAQRESLEKKRGFYSASPYAPRHSQAFWNLSMPCQGAAESN